MSDRWHPADSPRVAPTSDYASEIVWSMGTPCAVLDRTRRVVFTNLAFRASEAASALFDSGGRPCDPRVERAVSEVSRGEDPRTVLVLDVAGKEHPLEVEVIRLRGQRGWCALLAQTPPQDSRNDALPSPRLLLHELRAPLLGLNEALGTVTQKTEGEDGDLSAAVARLSRAFARLQGVLEAVQDLVSTTRVGPDHDWLEVALPAVLDDVCDVYSELAASQGHDLVVSIGSDLEPVRGDPRLLARLFGNLVDNAIKFTPPPGTIEVRAEARGTLTVVEVHDSGPGVPQDQRERVLEPFVRLDERGSGPPHPGSGLGLAVADRLARAHGASLTVDDSPIGGTVFRVAFLIPHRSPRIPLARWWGTR